MGFSDVLDKITGVSTGLGAVLDGTKTPKTTSEPAAQPRASGPVAKLPPAWLIWTLGIGGSLVGLYILFRFLKSSSA